MMRYIDVSGHVLTIALTLCLQCSSTRSSRSSRVVKLAWTVKRSCFWAAAGQQVCVWLRRRESRNDIAPEELAGCRADMLTIFSQRRHLQVAEQSPSGKCQLKMACCEGATIHAPTLHERGSISQLSR